MSPIWLVSIGQSLEQTMRQNAAVVTLLMILAGGIIAVSFLNLTLHAEVRALWLESPLGFLLMAIPVTCFWFTGFMWCRATKAAGGGQER